MNDLISRQKAIDAVHKNYDTILDFKSDGRTVADSFEDIINTLPSTQPERKKGKWERHYTRQNVYAGLCWNCSVCGYKNADNYLNVYYNYCPNCGADMRGEQDVKVR